MNKTILFLFFLTINLTINAQSWFGKKVKGNGKITTAKRNTSNYNKIISNGSFNVLLIKGKEGNISINGEENIIPLLETVVEKEVLKIRFKKNMSIRTTKKIVVSVPVTSIESIVLSGSGKISSDFTLREKSINTIISGSGVINLLVNTEMTSVTVSGSGRVYLAGKTKSLNTKISGSGSLKAYELEADNVSAKISGSGNAKVNVASSLNAKISGSGNVYYSGNPKEVNSKSSGSGKTIKRN